MGYAILFLVIGLIITAFGWWMWREIDRPGYEKEKIEDNRKAALAAIYIGIAITVISIWQIIKGIKGLF